MAFCLQNTSHTYYVVIMMWNGRPILGLIGF